MPGQQLAKLSNPRESHGSDCDASIVLTEVILMNPQATGLHQVIIFPRLCFHRFLDSSLA